MRREVSALGGAWGLAVDALTPPEGDATAASDPTAEISDIDRRLNQLQVFLRQVQCICGALIFLFIGCAYTLLHRFFVAGEAGYKRTRAIF
jgi:hypothetical protein